MKNDSERFLVTLLLLLLIGIVLQSSINYFEDNHNLFNHSQRIWQFFITPLSLFTMVTFAFFLSAKNSAYQKMLGKTFVTFLILGLIYTFGIFFLIGLGSGNK